MSDVRVESLPKTVQLDAWPGKRAGGRLEVDAENWGARRGLPPTQEPLEFDRPVDASRWEDDKVGYGILLLDTPDRAWSRDKVTGATAAEPIRRILATRPKTQLLYWSPELADVHVRRYYDDGQTSDLQIGLSPFGIAKDHLPRYVLVVGPPDRVPWSVQYSLAIRHAVGRLPFEADDLAPYVDTMLDGERGWAHDETDVSAPVVWTVDHGSRDITRLMRRVLTAPLVEALSGTLAGLTALDDASATSGGLITALAAKPALVVTSSHGATPLEQNALRATLGLPVDVSRSTVALADLTEAMPAGSVWFAQACCSAGSSAESSYSGLLAERTQARIVVDAVAAIGSTVSPAALTLLRRDHPVRGVFGHVEPTFDWTLKDTETNQKFGDDLVTGLSSNLHFGQPLGLALAAYREGIGVLTSRWARLSDKLKPPQPDLSTLPTMTRLRLTAWDRQSLVLLGDPTVRIPPLP